jgi:hypothetical protein
MYNISKVARSDVLVFFNRIFDGLSKVRDCCARRTLHKSTFCAAGP